MLMTVTCVAMCFTTLETTFISSLLEPVPQKLLSFTGSVSLKHFGPFGFPQSALLHVSHKHYFTVNHKNTDCFIMLESFLYILTIVCDNSTCQSFGTDCKKLIAMIKEPYAWPSFATELKRIETVLIYFPNFNISYVSRARNQFSDFLANTARSFYKKLFFIGYSISVWSADHLKFEQ